MCVEAITDQSSKSNLHFLKLNKTHTTIKRQVIHAQILLAHRPFYVFPSKENHTHHRFLKVLNQPKNDQIINCVQPTT
jgi:hypothetical protein